MLNTRVWLTRHYGPCWIHINSIVPWGHCFIALIDDHHMVERVINTNVSQLNCWILSTECIVESIFWTDNEFAMLRIWKFRIISSQNRKKSTTTRLYQTQSDNMKSDELWKNGSFRGWLQVTVGHGGVCIARTSFAADTIFILFSVLLSSSSLFGDVEDSPVPWTTCWHRTPYTRLGIWTWEHSAHENLFASSCLWILIECPLLSKN